MIKLNACYYLVNSIMFGEISWWYIGKTFNNKYKIFKSDTRNFYVIRTGVKLGISGFHSVIYPWKGPIAPSLSPLWIQTRYRGRIIKFFDDMLPTIVEANSVFLMHGEDVMNEDCQIKQYTLASLLHNNLY